MKFNILLYRLSLSGMGVLNYKNSRISGETMFLNNFLKGKDGTVVDIGANIGNYSLEVLRINPRVRVFAFEPHPITYASLVKNVSSNSNVVSINKGLSSDEGVLKLFDYNSVVGSSHASLYSDVITEIHGSNEMVFHEVELTTLDLFVEIENITEIALLKIDTEGNELAILRGGRNTLSKNIIKAIHFEFNEMNIASRSFFRDFWKLLDNYRIYRLLPNDMIEITVYDPLHCEIFAYQNIVAILKK